MSSEFTSRKLAWLEAVARDRALPRSAIAVAVLLACRYFNNETGEAWPSERTLAGDTGMTPANVHGAIERLVTAGVLRRRSGGPRAANRYSIPRRWKAPERYCGQERSAIVGNSTSGIADNSAAPLRAIAEPATEPENRTRERTPRREQRRSHRSVPRRARATLFPTDWPCGAAELEAAALSSARWERERAMQEFAKFQRWHTDRATRSTDWSESWKTWCERGAGIDARDRERIAPRRDRARAGVVGVARWYERQKQAAAAAAYVIPAREDDA